MTNPLFTWSTSVVRRWNEHNAKACKFINPHVVGIHRPLFLHENGNTYKFMARPPLTNPADDNNSVIHGPEFRYVANPSLFGEVWSRRFMSNLWDFTVELHYLGFDVHPTPEMASIINDKRIVPSRPLKTGSYADISTALHPYRTLPRTTS